MREPDLTPEERAAAEQWFEDEKALRRLPTSVALAAPDLLAACEALLDVVAYMDRGSTHYDGCERVHHRCAVAKQAQAAIAKARGTGGGT